MYHNLFDFCRGDIIVPAVLACLLSVRFVWISEFKKLPDKGPGTVQQGLTGTVQQGLTDFIPPPSEKCQFYCFIPTFKNGDSF